jgi:pyruvate/2-oxoglutarate dehydrogenase complex dihydrolipoamide dehydrogenase (E3) component
MTGRGAAIEVPNTRFHDSDDALRSLVHPPSWRNPVPADIYDLVVLGGGTAGLVSAMGAAGLGARVALFERHMLGGDCLNTGCVPSKALIRSARVAGEFSRAGSLGITVERVAVDFAKVMDRMRERRASIAVNDSAARLQRAGVDVFFGDARFADAQHVVVNDQRLKFRHRQSSESACGAGPRSSRLSDKRDDIFADGAPTSSASHWRGPDRL